MKQNVVIVMVDQQRTDLRKSRGYELDTMPFLDQWSAENTDFTKAYTPNPTCMPARTSMFTGRFANCHKVRTNHNDADAYYYEDMLDTFQKEGYVTALCGKNHSHRKECDFDFHESNGHDGIDDGREIEEDERGFDAFLKSLKHRESHEPSPYSLKEQQPYRNVSSAFKFIDGLEKDTPFFAWVSFAEPHNPYQVPTPYFDMFPPEVLPKAACTAEEAVVKGEKYQMLSDDWHGAFEGEDFEKIVLRTRSNYHGMLRLIDDQFKRLIDGLKERDLYDNTIVIYCSDHGDYSGEYGLIRKGADLPELLTHVPMAWHVPGLAPQGVKSDCFVNLVDIYPTLCDLLGFEIPFGVQGKVVTSLLDGSNAHMEEFQTAYSESGFSGLNWNAKDHLDKHDEGAYNPGCTYDELNSWTQCGQVRMARKGDYKIQYDMMGHGYLYQVEEDPYELHNLWDDEAYSAVKTEMLGVLLAETLKAEDPIPAPRNRYRTKIHPKNFWYDEEFVAEDPGVLNLSYKPEVK